MSVVRKEVFIGGDLDSRREREDSVGYPPEHGENLANCAREVVTLARQQVCQCHESVEFGLQVYGMKRYCGGERPDSSSYWHLG